LRATSFCFLFFFTDFQKEQNLFEGDELPFFVSPLQFPVLAQKQEADHELRANSTQEEMRERQRVWEQDMWRFFSFKKVFSLELHYIFEFSKVLSIVLHVIIARANVLLVCF